LWPKDVEAWIAGELLGYTLHVCHGKSEIGDVHLDLFELKTDVRGDAARLPFEDLSFNTVVIDPPYNSKLQWNHDMLAELPRVARDRIIFQHWYTPVNRKGQYKKRHRFTISKVAIWQPQTYFGRVNVISIFDDLVSGTQMEFNL
jgi:hypothetical protein